MTKIQYKVSMSWILLMFKLQSFHTILNEQYFIETAVPSYLYYKAYFKVTVTVLLLYFCCSLQ